MNNFHNLRDELGFAAASRPTINPLSELRSRAETLGATLTASLPASHHHTPQLRTSGRWIVELRINF